MANDDRIQGMRHEFSELRQAIASDIEERFKAGEERLREGLSMDLDVKLDVREQRLREGPSRDLDTKLEARETRLREERQWEAFIGDHLSGLHEAQADP